MPMKTLWTTVHKNAMEKLSKKCKSKQELVTSFKNKFGDIHSDEGIYMYMKRHKILFGPTKGKLTQDQKTTIKTIVSKDDGRTLREKVRDASCATGKTVDTIEHKLRALQEEDDSLCIPTSLSPWTDEEVEALIKATMEGHSREYISKFFLPLRTPRAIESKQSDLGILAKDMAKEADEQWEAFTIYDNKILDAVQNIGDAIKPLQEAPKEVFKHIHTDLSWIGIVISGDWHIGNATTHFKDLRRDIDLVAATEGMYYCFNGDGVENFTATSIASGMYEQIISPRGARIAMGRLFFLLKEKMIAAVLGCHDEFTVRSADFNLVETLSVDLKIPYLGAGGTVNVVMNDIIAYRIGMRHKWRFNSSHNLAHTCKQYIIQQDPTADIVAIAHNHESYIGQEDIYGKPRVLIRTGGYKPMDRFSDKLGYVETNCWIPVVLLNTKTKSMRMCLNIQEGVETLNHLNGGR